jgi:hypothetical protein
LGVKRERGGRADKRRDEKRKKAQEVKEAKGWQQRRGGGGRGGRKWEWERRRRSVVYFSSRSEAFFWERTNAGKAEALSGQSGGGRPKRQGIITRMGVLYIGLYSYHNHLFILIYRLAR